MWVALHGLESQDWQAMNPKWQNDEATATVQKFVSAVAADPNVHHFTK